MPIYRLLLHDANSGKKNETMVRALALRGKSLLRQTNTAPHVVFGMQGIKINLEAIITWLKKKKELPN